MVKTHQGGRTSQHGKVYTGRSIGSKHAFNRWRPKPSPLERGSGIASDCSNGLPVRPAVFSTGDEVLVRTENDSLVTTAGKPHEQDTGHAIIRMPGRLQNELGVEEGDIVTVDHVGPDNFSESPTGLENPDEITLSIDTELENPEEIVKYRGPRGFPVLTAHPKTGRTVSLLNQPS